MYNLHKVFEHKPEKINEIVSLEEFAQFKELVKRIESQ